MKIPEEAGKAIGARIRQAREPRTQGWLAGQMGVGQSAVSKWELGEPPASQLARLEIVLGLPAGTLWTIAYPEQAPSSNGCGPTIEAALERVRQIRAELRELEDTLRRART